MVSANSRLSCSVISSRTGSISCNGISLVTVPKGWSSRAVWWKRGWAEALCGLLELGFFGMKFSLSCRFGGKPEEEEIENGGIYFRSWLPAQPLLDANRRKWMPSLSDSDPL